MNINLLKPISDLKTKSKINYYDHIRDDLIPLVSGCPERILDIGCGKGYTARLFKERFQAKYVAGIEIDPEAAEIARHTIDDVYVINLDEKPIPFQANTFDLIILADIIEHLREPEKLLSQIHKIIKTEGQVIVCIPNVRNWRILWMLVLKSEWKYENEGIMDKTHLRFYTKKSATRLFSESGFIIERYNSRLRPKDRIGNLLTLNLFKDFFKTQHYFTLSRRKER